jgi:hypothetical protein
MLAPFHNFGSNFSRTHSPALLCVRHLTCINSCEPQVLWGKCHYPHSQWRKWGSGIGMDGPKPLSCNRGLTLEPRTLAPWVSTILEAPYWRELLAAAAGSMPPAMFQSWATQVGKKWAVLSHPSLTVAMSFLPSSLWLPMPPNWMS